MTSIELNSDISSDIKSIDSLSDKIEQIKLIEPKEDNIVNVKVNIIKPDYSNVLYYKLSFDSKDILELLQKHGINALNKSDNLEIFSKFSKEINNLKSTDTFAIISNKDSPNLYLLNNEFHITLFYNGGKTLSIPDSITGKTNFDKSEEIEKILNSNIQITMEKITISKEFITIRVKSIGDIGDIPYYGNPIMHITIGLSKTSGKKLQPANSPKAFEAPEQERTDILINYPTNLLIGIVKKVIT